MSIDSLLVANRGEIARRIFRTAREMGITTVGVFSDADEGHPFVAEADLAVRIDGYLDAEALLGAARRSGATAVHPGYGFLSENAAFAETILAAGLTWIGPSPKVIAAMGDKAAAKRIAEAAGVPTLASSDDLTAAGEVGYPLLVKATAGGGGKGMHLVRSEDELEEAVATARREAAAAFADDRVFLERYLERARHVEVQILGDTQGNLVHLGDRECSIQRRHQKIVEESPSPAIDDELRSAMGEAALSLARDVGYHSAGTVEFILDDTTREFFFLEANTRLQVEHPVTEETTGIDLVREQIRIAAGEPLGYVQQDVVATGHAIEARLYAEDPASGFLPDAGTVEAFAPAAEPKVRFDSGVEAGTAIGVDFDPLLAKVVAHGHTRTEAAARLARALERLHLGGVDTNRDFLVATLRHEAFLAGDTTTDFIERHAPRRTLEPDDDELARATRTAAMWIQGRNRKRALVLGHIRGGWRNARLPNERVRLSVGGLETTVSYQVRRDGTFLVDDALEVRVHRWAEDCIDLEVDGVRTTHAVTEAGSRLHVQTQRGTVEVNVLPRFELPEVQVPEGGLVAPMPCRVIEVRVAVGDRVTAGQTLLVVEAMKMEHHLKAPHDGTVAEVLAELDEQVANGVTLMVLDEDAPEGHEDD
ncbi:MAG: biotin carboxylase N-terminal domain-containing protein [Acidimicrobiales bacterium]|nr:biotin carboxylase N-terminal domain-containing protein [Acidimicrobiales bacterium]